MIDGKSNLVITGAGQGIGRAIARHFAVRGHSLFLVDINKEGVQHTAEVHLKEYADRIEWAHCDLTDVHAVRATAKRAAERFEGRIDFLINNAGISHPYWKDGMTMEDEATMDQFKMYVDVNLIGNFAMSQACIPFMKVKKNEDKEKLPGSTVGSAGPCILNLSSFRGIISDPHQEGYAATKAGLIMLTSAMAVSLSQLGIRVNCISPGRIKATHESVEGDDNGNRWANEDKDADDHPTNRAGKPEDIAEAAEYLLGAGFVSGQNLVVDGGVTVVK